MSAHPPDAGAAIFISVGHFLTPREARFVESIKDELGHHGLIPVTIERRAQMIDDPIATIRRVIHESAGTIVVAIERQRIVEAVEFPKSSDFRVIAPRVIPTVWNQIEAAMTLKN